MSMRARRFRPVCAAAIILGVMLPARQAVAQISDDAVRIGVLTDMSGAFSDVGGQGSVVAAEMAAQDFGGTVRGKPIRIVSADHQNKPDVGAAIARAWFDRDGIDAVADLPVTSVALAVIEIAREKQRTTLIAGAASSDITGRFCSPYATHWADDSYALAHGTAQAVTKAGGTSWFFITADYAFGHAMERDAAAAVTAAGGTVTGNIRHPLATPDFSSYLLRAQASRAQVIGLASAGRDTVTAIKQAAEFGIADSDKRVAGFLVFISDVHSVGLPVARDLLVATGFYWDQNDAARAFGRRFFASTGRMPTKQQASVYASVTQYLKTVDAAGTDAAGAVNRTLRALPVDYFGHPAVIRADGRVLYDLTLYAVKAPAESKAPYDYYRPLVLIPAAEAFRPEGEGGCALAPNPLTAREIHP